ncbi:MAG TPA: hypothetical protein VFR14_01775 [Candidatus Limnocylindrales bacterium]|nr:hypothetical protein [Candidatus Limnocylindrales bacterium]
MQGPIDLQATLVRSRMAEREAEAAADRLAAQARGGRPNGDGIRRWLGRRLVLAGAAIARDGLVEGSGEPIARGVGRASGTTPAPRTGGTTAATRPDPCFDAESTLGHAA